jgi:AraC family transcriptional activator of pobA
MAKNQNGIPRLDICNLVDSKRDDLMISRLSEYLQEHQNLVFPHRHSFYHLVFFTIGGGSHTIDFQRFEVKPFQIYFMAPGQVHSWDFEGEMEGVVINFSGTFFQSFLLRAEYLDSFSFLSGNAEDNVINLSQDNANKVKQLLESLIEQSVHMHIMQEDMIRVLLLQVFLTLEQNHYTATGQAHKVTQNMIIKNFNRLVEKNFAEMKMPGPYAQLLNVTPNHLNALVKEHLGKQAGEVIRDRVLLEAKRLLVNKDMTISEISYRLNFNDNSYFTRFFRKYAGVTPETFREKSVSSIRT